MDEQIKISANIVEDWDCKRLNFTIKIDDKNLCLEIYLDDLLSVFNVFKNKKQIFHETIEIKDLSENDKPESTKILYDYEMFFKSESNDFCKIDGWYPISTDRIKDIQKIDEYIKNGLLRKV